MSDVLDELQAEGGSLVAEVDVLGLYRPERGESADGLRFGFGSDADRRLKEDKSAMSDVRLMGASGDLGDGPQPASGPMDKVTARWYVEHTGGQFEAFARDGVWFLCTPDWADPVARPAASRSTDG